MRVVIIGLDGLEATLIDPQRYPNICQAEHGTIDLSGFNQVQTPQIWTSFITGDMPNKHGIDGFKHRTLFSKIEKQLSGYIKKFLSHFGVGSVNWATNIKNGIYEHYNDHPYQPYTKEDIKTDTIFDQVQNSCVISLPVYNEPKIYTDIRRMTAKAVGHKDLTHELTNMCLDLYKEETTEFMKHLHSDVDLLMVHLFISDVYGHLYGHSEDKILELYDLFEDLVGRTMKNDSFTIILSDHGTKCGLHTHYGFYSLSRPLGLNNPHITDFYDIIMEVVE